MRSVTRGGVVLRLPGGWVSPARPTDRQISGPAAHWVEALTGLALGQGSSSFILWALPEERALRLFSEEIDPAVRERVAAARG